MKNSETTNEFDIVRLAEQFQGKTLEELFPNHRILRNGMGEFLEIRWELNEGPSRLNLPITKNWLLKNIKIVENIGEHTEKDFLRRGITSIADLKQNLRYGDSAREILESIEKRDHVRLYQTKDVHDLDVLFCFDLEELLFLDIETMGLHREPMILVGIGYYVKDKFSVHQFFARALEEEISICEHLKSEIFPAFKCFVTYNGKSFDIPYLANRFLYFFDKNPMVHEGTLLEGNNAKFHHVDLYHNCRRKYKNLCESFALTSVERNVLKWRRPSNIPGHMIGAWYKKYLKNPKKYAGLMKELVDHNFHDIRSMPFILEKLLKT